MLSSTQLERDGTDRVPVKKFPVGDVNTRHMRWKKLLSDKPIPQQSANEGILDEQQSRDMGRRPLLESFSLQLPIKLLSIYCINKGSVNVPCKLFKRYLPDMKDCHGRELRSGKMSIRFLAFNLADFLDVEQRELKAWVFFDILTQSLGEFAIHARNIFSLAIRRSPGRSDSEPKV
jgi:hypothetical protein